MPWAAFSVFTNLMRTNFVRYSTEDLGSQLYWDKEFAVTLSYFVIDHYQS